MLEENMEALQKNEVSNCEVLCKRTNDRRLWESFTEGIFDGLIILGTIFYRYQISEEKY